ncbi:tetratricopeptide repeat protein [Maribacter sp. ACAM166]|uniref:tetratricopeptide repeat-containing sensor histidine kinase n=1 Tax=Maribacter sp. ACAM166 TaxID=2508996 RepID=UPI0014853C27|nr:tetratricopeptide repeat protein [Maribacter sp. ACAM166]
MSFAQTRQDSTLLYYKAIVDPEKPENLPAGINFYLKKKQSALIKKDTLSAIRNLRLIAIGEFKIGNSYNSENYIVEALNLIKSMSSNDTLFNEKVGLYNQLGRIYRASRNPTAAINSFNEALAIAQETKDSIIILNNKANVYKDELDYTNAMDIYSLLYEKGIKSQDSLQMALVLDNLGYVQSKLNLPEALENLKKALDIRTHKNYLVGLHSSNNHFSEYYLDRNDTAQARAYSKKALALAHTINSSSLKLDALSLLMRLDENPIVNEYKRLTDSISDAKQLAENKNAFLKYNVAEEQKKTQASKLLQEVESRKLLVYQFLALFILLLLIASYFIYSYRYRKAKIEEIYKTETRIAKKVHDEVANDMYKMMTSLENTPGIENGVLDEMERIYSKTRDISRENSAIDLHHNFGLQLNDLLLGYTNQEVTIVTRNLSKIDWEAVTEIKKTAIYRVLQELMTNMRKHSMASSVALIFSKEGSKIEVKYRDNGIGCDLLKKNGLQNTESRIVSINGTINFESKKNDGFKATITI